VHVNFSDLTSGRQCGGTEKKPTKSSVKQLAATTGISERQLARYFSAGCPRTSAKAVLAWKEKNIRPPGDVNSGPTSGSLSEARMELLIQQTAREAALAEKYEVENAVRRGELIEKAEVERDTSIVLSRLRNRLGSLGMEISTLMPTEMKVIAQQQVENSVRMMLQELPNGFRSIEEN
jgi:hypothetical protein